MVFGFIFLWDKITNSIAYEPESEFAQIMCEAIKLELAAACPELLMEKDENKEMEGVVIGDVHTEETQEVVSFTAFAAIEAVKNSFDFGRRKTKTD